MIGLADAERHDIITGPAVSAEPARPSFHQAPELPDLTMTLLPRRRSFCWLLVTTTALLLPMNPGLADEKQKQKKSPERWEENIQSIEQKLAAGNPPKADVVFVGSSSIRKWDLAKSFPGLNAVNHGFGGSQLSDSVHFFSRIVTPAKPRVVVLYAGDNDLSDGKTPDTVVKDFEKFLGRIDSELPDCQKVIFVCIKPSIKRWKLRDAARETNEQIRKICDKHPKAEYADVWAPALNAAGEPRRELLDKDDLHLTDAGYELWSSILRPMLQIQP